MINRIKIYWHVADYRKKLKYVFVHDAARPNVSKNLLLRIKKNISSNKYDAVIPYLNIEDTIKIKQYKSKLLSVQHNPKNECYTYSNILEYFELAFVFHVCFSK